MELRTHSSLPLAGTDLEGGRGDKGATEGPVGSRGRGSGTKPQDGSRAPRSPRSVPGACGGGREAERRGGRGLCSGGASQGAQMSSDSSQRAAQGVPEKRSSELVNLSPGASSSPGDLLSSQVLDSARPPLDSMNYGNFLVLNFTIQVYYLFFKLDSTKKQCSFFFLFGGPGQNSCKIEKRQRCSNKTKLEQHRGVHPGKEGVSTGTEIIRAE